MKATAPGHPPPGNPPPNAGAWLRAFLSDPSFLAKYPYYAAILGKMHAVADPSVGRMAVSFDAGRFYLHVNVESFLREPEYLRGVLLHEVHHVVLGHLTHPKFEDPAEPELMDLAVEMSANEFIDEPLPNPILWRSYSAAGIRARQSTLERYEILIDMARAGKRPRPDPRGDGGHGGHEPAAVDDHRFLRQGDRIPGGLSQTASMVKAALESDVAKRARDAEKERKKKGRLTNRPVTIDEPFVCGMTPGKLLETLSGDLRPPTSYVDWKTALQMFVAFERSPVHTYGRPNRRFPSAIGQVPGRTFAPRAVARPHLLVAIDTSLSMTLKELDEIARQLKLVSERATITVCECDAAVTRTYAFEGAIANVVGRGGTDFRPIFAPENLRGASYDGVVVFTDGDGPFPKEAPPLRVLWVLTKPGAFTCPWGERAWLGVRRR